MTPLPGLRKLWGLHGSTGRDFQVEDNCRVCFLRRPAYAVGPSSNMADGVRDMSDTE